MLKIIGAISVICGALMWGMNKCMLLKKRICVLKQSQTAAWNADARIRCLHLPLDECFEGDNGILGDASQLIKEGYLPTDAVIKAAENNRYITERDREIFRGFASGLSAADCEGQLANIKLFCQRTAAAISDAEDDFNTRGKLIFQGSLLCGAAVVIVFI